jgi:hypothetical protein
MTLRDPYKDPARDSDPYEAFDKEPRVVRARNEGYSSGSMIGAVIALAVVIAAGIYFIQRTTTFTGTRPSTTSTSEPSSTGQGGGHPPAPQGRAGRQL